MTYEKPSIQQREMVAGELADWFCQIFPRARRCRGGSVGS